MGAGPGTACWAAADLFPNAEQFVLIEKNQEMLALGKQIGSHHPSLAKAIWQRETAPGFSEAADAAIFSYSLGEMEHPHEWILAWERSLIPFLVIIEPGTPRGFSLIRKARDEILSKGCHIVAPCPHALACPMQQGDWCHFAVRLSRTKLQRYLKEGALGYEDEKYSYLIASRKPPSISEMSRVLRRPQKLSGRVLLTLCTPSGKAEEVCITKSRKEGYRLARDAAWGDMFNASCP